MRYILTVIIFPLVFMGCIRHTICYNGADCIRQTQSILEVGEKGNNDDMNKYLVKIGYMKDAKNGFTEYEEEAHKYGIKNLKRFGIPSGNNRRISIDTISRVLHPGSKPYYEINIKIEYNFPEKDSLGGEFEFLYFYNMKGYYSLGMVEFFSATRLPGEPKMPPPILK